MLFYILEMKPIDPGSRRFVNKEFISMAAKNYGKNSELRLILISDYRVHLIKRQQTEY